MSGTFDAAERFAERIARELEARRRQITELMRVVGTFHNAEGSPPHAHVLERTACAMAVPMLYAHWEGFVRVTLAEYVEFIERAAVPNRALSSPLLAYALNRHIDRLKSNMSVVGRVRLVDAFFDEIHKPARFHDVERRIDTKANLKYHVLCELLESLNIDSERFKESEKAVDALVNRRNNIAHGGREQRITVGDIEEIRVLVLDLFDALEKALLGAVQEKKFLCPFDRLGGIDATAAP